MNHSIKPLIILFNILVSFSFLFIGNAFCGTELKEVIIVFRFDDFSSKSDTDLEEKIIEQFKKRNIPITLAVIPFVLDKNIGFPDSSQAKKVALSFIVKHEGRRSRYFSPGYIIPLTTKKAEILKKGMNEGILEVALHGYTHERNGVSNNHKSEFKGIDFEMQVKMLDEGKSLLENILGEKIKIFVPPFNSYDMNTVRALEKLGFGCLSAGMLGEVEESVALKFFPNTCELTQLREAIDSARRIQDPQPIITVLFHSYDFKEVDKTRGMFTLDDFIALIDFISSQKDLRVLSIGNVMERINDFGPRRYSNNNNLNEILYHTPHMLRVLSYPEKSHIYLTSSVANQYIPWSLSILILFYMGILGASVSISFVIGDFVLHRLHFVHQIYKYVGPIIFIIVSGYTLHNFSVGYYGAIAMVLSLGICIGNVSALRKIKSSLPFRVG